ncbi:hypothetical protein D3C80_1516490 [compost metagenome]
MVVDSALAPGRNFDISRARGPMRRYRPWLWRMQLSWEREIRQMLFSRNPP